MDSSSLVTVQHSSASVIYHIHEKNLFDNQGFKTLQRYYDSGFVSCKKGTVNGNIRLVYDVSGLTTLSQFASRMDNRSFLKITFHLLRTALVLREIGFLQRENISIEPSEIYIDENALRTYLIYLPLNVRTAPNAHMKFEKNLRTMLAQIAERKFSKHKTDFVLEIRDDLLNIQVSPQEIVSKIESQALQTTEENTQKVTGRRSQADTKTYPAPVATPEPIRPTPPVATAPVRQPARESTHAPVEPIPRSQTKISPEKKKKAAMYIGFAVGYSVLFFASIWIIANYYSNSGLTLSFILTMIAVLILDILLPVLFLMRKDRKNGKVQKQSDFLSADFNRNREFQPTLVLKNIGSEWNLEFFINKKEFVIGKDNKNVDGFIPFDKTIADQHCKVTWNGKYYIQDLGSDYGTFVNGDRVVLGQSFPIRSGDKVQISKHIFLVREI